MNAPRRLTALLCFVLSAIPAFSAKSDWHLEFPSFRIAGNLYYVGTADLAAYLVSTPSGLILINSNMPTDLPLLRQAIKQLGFNYHDIRILLISHAHSDHDAAVGIIKRETGARLMVMDADVPAVETLEGNRAEIKVDRILHDGDTVALGGEELVARLTPGHTKGCTTWTMRVQQNQTVLNAVIVGSVNVNPGYILIGNLKYPEIATDYEKSFQILERLPADLFLGSHGSFFDLKAKYPRLLGGETNAFLDQVGYQHFLAEKKAAFLMEKTRQETASARTR